MKNNATIEMHCFLVVLSTYIFNKNGVEELILLHFITAVLPVVSPEMPDAVRTQINLSATTAGILLKTIQRISFLVSPALLDEFGLEVAIEWLCNEFHSIHKIPCELTTENDESLLTNVIQIGFFRICQKALANVATHANSSQVYITIIQKKIL